MPAVVLLLEGVHSPCPTEHTGEAPCDDPIVLSLLKEALRHGQAVVAYLHGTVVTVCCAVTRIVLLICDIACLPIQWLGHCWGFAFHWAVGNVGGGAGGMRTRNLLANDGQPERVSDLRGLQEGTDFAVGDPKPTAPPSPASARGQLRTLSIGNTKGSVTVRFMSGHELTMISPSSTIASEAPSPSSVAQPPTPSSGVATKPNGGWGSGGNDEPELIMPFQHGDGEDGEASSLALSSITNSRAGRPVRWSGENTEEGCDNVMDRGGFGKVAVTTNKTSGLKIGVKSILRTTAGFGSMDEIINTDLKTLQAAGVQSNVVDRRGDTKTRISVHIAMPIIAAHLDKLITKVGSLSDDMANPLMRQLISAVKHLHSRNVLHRDLKPASMLLTEAANSVGVVIPDDTLLLADSGITTITIIAPGETVVVSGLPCGTKVYPDRPPTVELVSASGQEQEAQATPASAGASSPLQASTPPPPPSPPLPSTTPTAEVPSTVSLKTKRKEKKAKAAPSAEEVTGAQTRQAARTSKRAAKSQAREAARLVLNMPTRKGGTAAKTTPPPSNGASASTSHLGAGRDTAKGTQRPTNPGPSSLPSSAPTGAADSVARSGCSAAGAGSVNTCNADGPRASGGSSSPAPGEAYSSTNSGTGGGVKKVCSTDKGGAAAKTTLAAPSTSTSHVFTRQRGAGATATPALPDGASTSASDVGRGRDGTKGTQGPTSPGLLPPSATTGAADSMARSGCSSASATSVNTCDAGGSRASGGSSCPAPGHIFSSTHSSTGGGVKKGCITDKGAFFRDKVPRRTGLLNGNKNRCAANSVAQVMRHNPVLWKALTGLGGDSAWAGTLAGQLGRMLKAMEGGGECYIHPSVVTCINGSSSRSANVQRDAGEVILRLLGALEDEANKRGNKIVQAALQGMKGEINYLDICPCDTVTDTADEFVLLPVPMQRQGDGDGAVHLPDLLSKVFGTSGVDVCEDCRQKPCEESLRDPQTKARRKSRSATLANCPDRLMLQLGRYTGDDKVAREKLVSLVTIPTVLNVGPYTDVGKVLDEVEILYDLDAVIHHIMWKGEKGDVDGQRGHYVAFTRTSHDKWFKYDDLKVSTVDASKVLTNQAYILSYAKRS